MSKETPKPPTLKEKLAGMKQLADQIRKLMGPGYFTIPQLVKVSIAGHSQATEMLLRIDGYGFLSGKQIDDKNKFMVVMDPEERTKIFDSKIEKAKMNIAAINEDVKFWKKLKKIKLSVLSMEK